METKLSARKNYLDWLRVLGILLVFAFHSSRIYNVEDWNVKNNIWYPSVEAWVLFASSFMMPLMFVISGASLFYAMGKGGFGKFIKDKVLSASASMPMEAGCARRLVPTLSGRFLPSAMIASMLCSGLSAPTKRQPGSVSTRPQ